MSEPYRERWQACISTDFETDKRGLRVRVRMSDRTWMSLRSMGFEHLERGAGDAPVLVETREDRDDAIGDVTGFVQAILDAAWDAGMRPAAQKDATEELKAVRYHLEDMRALAFERPKP